MSNAPNAMPDTIKKTIPRGLRNMDDHTLHWWASVMHTAEVSSLVVTAIAAVCLCTSVWLAKKFSHEIHERESAAFAKYKVDAGVLIEDAKKEGVQAGKSAGDAMLRAAELEKEAAQAKERTAILERGVAEANARAEEARLALERFKAPRWITDEQRDRFVLQLKRFQSVTADVWLLHAPSSDAAPLAGRLLGVLTAIGLQATGVFNSMGGPSAAGVFILVPQDATGSEQSAAKALLEELNSAGIATHIEVRQTEDPLKVFGAFTGPSGTKPSRLWLAVGSKP